MTSSSSSSGGGTAFSGASGPGELTHRADAPPTPCSSSCNCTTRTTVSCVRCSRDPEFMCELLCDGGRWRSVCAQQRGGPVSGDQQGSRADHSNRCHAFHSGPEHVVSQSPGGGTVLVFQNLGPRCHLISLRQVLRGCVACGVMTKAGSPATHDGAQ